jgi:hypothetical protein
MLSWDLRLPCSDPWAFGSRRVLRTQVTAAMFIFRNSDTVRCTGCVAVQKPQTTGLSDRPVFDAQAGHAAEVAPVGSDDHSPVLQGDGGDSRVHEANIQP